MKKVLLLLSLACTTLSFAGNPVSERAKAVEQKCKELTSRYEARPQAGMRMELNGMKKGPVVMSQKNNAAQESHDKTGFDNVRKFLQAAEAQSKIVVDSCIVYDKDEKIFARDYYYYHPLDYVAEGVSFPGALKAIEMYQLNEETGEWTGYRQSAEYDKFGNAKFRLIETKHGDEAWVPQMKYISTYLAREGDLTLDESYNYDPESKKWFGNNKMEMTYDAQGRKTLSITYIWDETLEQWADYQKTQFIYEEHKTTELTTEWNGSGWTNQAKMEKVRDENENEISMEIAEWSLEDNAWKITMKAEHSYDADGRVTEARSFGIDEEGAPFVNYKYIYQYDGNTAIQETYILKDGEWEKETRTIIVTEKDLEIERTTCRAKNGEWINETKATNEYNSADALTMTMTQVWDGEAWLNEGRNVLEYDANGNEIHNVYSIFDNGEWVKNSELISGYAPNGKPTLLESYITDEETGKYIGSRKETYLFDENGRDQRDIIYVWNLDTDGWEISEDARYFYSDLYATGVKDNVANQVVVSAAVGTITIQNGQGANAQLYGVNGMLIRNSAIVDSTYIISADKGIYLVKVGNHTFKVNVQ